MDTEGTALRFVSSGCIAVNADRRAYAG